MFDAGVLSFQEYMKRESLPLATIQRTVLDFLRGRDDVVVFGAQAVNAIDLLSTHAEQFAQELQNYLRQPFILPCA
jgi:hypothetical protein